MTPKIRIEVQDFQKHKQLLHSKCFHLICTPARCIDICTKISRGLKAESVTKSQLESQSQDISSLASNPVNNANQQFETPILIWEPVPGATSPTTFSECVKALNNIDIFSPNSKEAADFLGLPEPETKPQIRKVALQFLVHMIHKRVTDVDAETEKETKCNMTNVNSCCSVQSPTILTSSLSSSSLSSSSSSVRNSRSISTSRQLSPAPIPSVLSSNPYPRAVVVRCGAKGCAIYSLTEFPTSEKHTETVIPVFFDVVASSEDKSPITLRYYEAWFPAYFSDPTSDDYRVEDPTGGGNTFLGGFAAGYLNSNNTNATAGNLAKAAIYGNIAAGLAIEQVGVPQLNKDEEKWNGDSIQARLETYMSRHGLDPKILEGLI